MARKKHKIKRMEAKSKQTKQTAPSMCQQPQFIKKYLSDGASLWGSLKRVPGYGIQCTQLVDPQKYDGTTFHYNLVRETENGKIYFAIFPPTIYPGKKRIYFEVQYLTSDRKLYCDIIVFRTNTEPKQCDALKIIEGVLLTQAGREELLSICKGWNAGYLFCDYMNLLSMAIYSRKIKEVKEKLNNTI